MPSRSKVESLGHLGSAGELNHALGYASGSFITLMIVPTASPIPATASCLHFCKAVKKISTITRYNIYLGPVITLGVISLVLVATRMHTRVSRAGRLFADDWLMVIAEIFSVAEIGCAVAAVSFGWGKPSAYFTPDDLLTTLKLNFALQTLWYASLCFVRLSVTCSLLRFGKDRAWLWPLYFLMALQGLISLSSFVTQFAQCKPLSANWGHVPGSVCWDIGAIITYAYAVAGIYIVMDLVLSLMPIRLLRTLHRSTSEKILIGVLMSLGLLATAIACAKLTTFPTLGQGDMMQASIVPSVYAKPEEQVGIITASLPCLKGPAQNQLKKLGLSKENHSTKPVYIGNDSTSRIMELEQKNKRISKSKAKVELSDAVLSNKGSYPSL